MSYRKTLALHTPEKSFHWGEKKQKLKFSKTSYSTYRQNIVIDNEDKRHDSRKKGCAWVLVTIIMPLAIGNAVYWSVYN